MHIVVIHGPQGSGKTRRGEELRKHYGCSHIVEDWDGVSPLRDGALALSHTPPPYRQAGIRCISITVAKQSLGV